MPVMPTTSFRPGITAAVSVAVFFAVSAPGAARADDERGRLLYENNCTVCHTSVVHVREDHKAADLAAVEAYVARWSGYLKLPWSAEDRAAVARHLDAAFYHFGTRREIR